jgi:hypothetical protein
MSLKLTGAIKVIGKTVQVTDKFTKREIVITDTSTQYPQDIMFQFTQDKCSQLDPFMEGQEVEISFNLRGRLWTSPQGEDKYFNTLEGWRIELVNGSTAAAAAKPQIKPTTSATIDTSTDVDDDLLPF